LPHVPIDVASISSQSKSYLDFGNRSDRDVQEASEFSSPALCAAFSDVRGNGERSTPKLGRETVSLVTREAVGGIIDLKRHVVRQLPSNKALV